MKLFDRFLCIVQQLFESELSYNKVVVDIDEEEIKELVSIAKNHRMLNVLYNVLIIKFPNNRYVKYLYNSNQQYLKDSLMVFHKAIDMLERNNYSYCIIKGMPLSTQIYGDSLVRDIGDIDIIINVNDLKELYTDMKNIGYYQVDNNDSDDPILYFSDEYFEIKLVADTTRILPHIELKWGSSAFVKQDIAWFENVELVWINGDLIKTQNKTYALIHMFANTFTDNEDRVLSNGNIIRNYFDLAYYLEYSFHDDFNHVINVAKSLNCNRKIFSVLNSLKQLFSFNNFDINQAVKLSKSDALLYPEKMPYFSVKDDFMGGSRVPNNIVRMTSAMRIVDKDLAYYEYVRNHKLSVFSKLCLIYINRKVMKADEITEWIKCESQGSVFYRYCNYKDFIKIECKIDAKTNEDLKEKYGVKIIVINSNSFVPTLYDQFYLPINTKELSRSRVETSAGKEYSNAFINEHNELFIEPIVYGNVKKIENTYVYSFEIQKDSVLIEHNNILFEFRLYRIHSNGIHTNMGYKQEILEFLGM